MPHLRLEYTANIGEKIDFADLFAELHHILAETGGIDIRNCKSRALQMNDYLVADGKGAPAFIHLDVRFLEGKRPEVKRKIGEALLACLRMHFEIADDQQAAQVSVEIRDIERNAYFKHPPLSR